jgi:hypothetical protein
MLRRDREDQEDVSPGVDDTQRHILAAMGIDGEPAVAGAARDESATDKGRMPGPI